MNGVYQSYITYIIFYTSILYSSDYKVKMPAEIFEDLRKLIWVVIHRNVACKLLLKYVKIMSKRYTRCKIHDTIDVIYVYYLYHQ